MAINLVSLTSSNNWPTFSNIYSTIRIHGLPETHSLFENRGKEIVLNVFLLFSAINCYNFIYIYSLTVNLTKTYFCQCKMVFWWSVGLARKEFSMVGQLAISAKLDQCTFSIQKANIYFFAQNGKKFFRKLSFSSSEKSLIEFSA